MHNVIWKFQVPLDGRFSLRMPDGATILSVQVQHGAPCLWAAVDPSAPLVSRPFAIVATGRADPEVLEWGKFVGTFQMVGGDVVFHLFTMPFAIPIGGDLNDD